MCVACPENKWGPNCRNSCPCLNGAKCDPVNGSCTCTRGWKGFHCDLPCPKGSYGLGCQQKCKVFNFLTRNKFLFSFIFNCFFFFSFLGLEIIIGSMRHVVSVVIKPFAIPFRVPAHANPVGTDPCKTHTIIKMAMRQRISSLPFLIFLFSIQRCDDPCPDGTHGQNCASNCRCQNDGTCNPIDGNCFCKDGWTVSAFYIGNKKKNLYNM